MNPQAVNPQAEPGSSLAEAVRAVVKQVAPEELASFDEIAALFFHDPAAALGARRQPDKPTESGPTGLEGLITPIVLAVLAQLASDTIADAVRKAIGAAVKSGRKGLAKLSRKPRVDEKALLDGPKPAVTAAQLQEMGEQIRSLAKLKGLPPELADVLCAAVRDALEADPGDGPAAA